MVKASTYVSDKLVFHLHRGSGCRTVALKGIWVERLKSFSIVHAKKLANEYTVY